MAEAPDKRAFKSVTIQSATSTANNAAQSHYDGGHFTTTASMASACLPALRCWAWHADGRHKFGSSWWGRPHAVGVEQDIDHPVRRVELATCQVARNGAVFPCAARKAASLKAVRTSGAQRWALQLRWGLPAGSPPHSVCGSGEPGFAAELLPAVRGTTAQHIRTPRFPEACREPLPHGCLPNNVRAETWRLVPDRVCDNSRPGIPRSIYDNLSSKNARKTWRLTNTGLVVTMRRHRSSDETMETNPAGRLATTDMVQSVWLIWLPDWSLRNWRGDRMGSRVD